MLIAGEPLKRAGTPEEIAQIIEFLASERVFHHWSNHRHRRRQIGRLNVDPLSTASLRPAASPGTVSLSRALYARLPLFWRVDYMATACAVRMRATSSTSPGPPRRSATPARWHAFVDALFHTEWVVYVKPAFGGATAVLRYLGRYTHRVAISNHRLIAFDGERVTFRWKDYAQGEQWHTMTLTAMEFLRRFVQHVLPLRFVRIRQFGYLASACRTALALARTLVWQPPEPLRNTAATAAAIWRCPPCGTPEDRRAHPPPTSARGGLFPL